MSTRDPRDIAAMYGKYDNLHELLMHMWEVTKPIARGPYKGRRPLIDRRQGNLSLTRGPNGRIHITDTDENGEGQVLMSVWRKGKATHVKLRATTYTNMRRVCKYFESGVSPRLKRPVYLPDMGTAYEYVWVGLVTPEHVDNYTNFPVEPDTMVELAPHRSGVGWTVLHPTSVQQLVANRKGRAPYLKIIRQMQAVFDGITTLTGGNLTPEQVEQTLQSNKGQTPICVNMRTASHWPEIIKWYESLPEDTMAGPVLAFALQNGIRNAKEVALAWTRLTRMNHDDPDLWEHRGIPVAKVNNSEPTALLKPATKGEWNDKANQS